MNPAEPDPSEATVVMTGEALAEAIDAMAREIAAANGPMGSVVLLGILRRGRPLAERIAARIEEATGVLPRVGSLATTLYRDDLRAGKGMAKRVAAETHFEFDVDGVTVILVDDVIAAGRTVRAALDEIVDYGRPKCIQLACLVDRGLRELPIQPDYLGCSIQTAQEDHVAVRLEECDGEDIVLLKRAPTGE